MSLQLEGRFRRSSGARTAAALGVAAGYAVLAVLACGLSLVVRDGMPWTHPSPWLTLAPTTAIVASSVAGLGFALAVVFLTRVAVPRFVWARRLHIELRPV